ncbi:unnamed protein product, partial [Mesorhabditis belari]|uniref:Nuclear receptor domain-containing protein n=1 Tax=Mesorhabditis belari TaxID=2138241 RepID=A0AAF3J8M6_9BILA
MADETSQAKDSTSTSKHAKKCLICGATPAYNVYGSVACGSCKNFFMRVATSDRELPPCQSSGQCVEENFLAKG